MRPKPYGRPKNAKGPNNGEQLSNFDSPRYENNKPRSPNGNRNYQQLFDKYTNLAREALSGGDRVAAEFHYQYADHYLRLINERQNQRVASERYKRSEVVNDGTVENSDNITENGPTEEEYLGSELEVTEENVVEPM